MQLFTDRNDTGTAEDTISCTVGGASPPRGPEASGTGSGTATGAAPGRARQGRRPPSRKAGDEEAAAGPSPRAQAAPAGLPRPWRGSRGPGRAAGRGGAGGVRGGARGSLAGCCRRRAGRERAALPSSPPAGRRAARRGTRAPRAPAVSASGFWGSGGLGAAGGMEGAGPARTRGWSRAFSTGAAFYYKSISKASCLPRLHMLATLLPGEAPHPWQCCRPGWTGLGPVQDGPAHGWGGTGASLGALPTRSTLGFNHSMCKAQEQHG